MSTVMRRDEHCVWFVWFGRAVLHDLYIGMTTPARHAICCSFETYLSGPAEDFVELVA